MSNSKLNCHRSIYELSVRGLEMAEENRGQSQTDKKKSVWMDVIII
jgi:hypothetical protein